MDDKSAHMPKTKPDVGSAPPLPNQPISDDAEVVRTDEKGNSPEPEKTKPQSSDNPEKTKPKLTVQKPNWLKRLFSGWWREKLWTLPLTIVVILAVLAGLPWSRYQLAGLVLKQNFSVDVIDATTNQPVSNARVTLDQLSAATNGSGIIKLQIHVGHRQLSVSKQYYKAYSASVLVPILKQKTDLIIKLQATGRQVPLTVTNTINGQPVSNVLIRVADTEITTNNKGQASVVLPANDTQLSANFSAYGYNDGSGTVTVTTQDISQNHFSLTPAGKLYFLSQLSGTLDVVKANLDGTDRQTVLAGTGNESPNDTFLVASRDWKYLVLESSRSHTNQPELYLINTTANDQLTTFDTTAATFNPVGWVGDTFIYSLTRNNVQSWLPGGEILKAYNAANGQLTVLDQTTATGTDSSNFALTTFGGIFLVNGTVIYTTNWSGSDTSQLSGKSDSLLSIQPDGSNKQDLKDFPVPASLSYPSYYLSSAQYSPLSIYLQVPDGNGNNSYYTLTNANLTSSSITDSTFYNLFPIYLFSPSGNQTFWYEQRDSKNTLFIGDASGLNAKQIATLSDYVPYGWYTDNYLIVAKDGELYIMPVGGGNTIKVTDYFSSLTPGEDYGG
jgi:hypothetical protein